VAGPSTHQPNADEIGDLPAMYRAMSLARQLDERMWRLARSGRAHFAVPCSGHEGIGAGYSTALRAGHDFLAPHYRDLSAVLSLGLSARDVMLHFFAKAADPCSGGRQPYAHWGSHRLRIVSLQGPQPNHVTHAVGVAWGSRLLGENSVTWISFGDGGAQKGEVHEAMNFAAIHRLPCVFCIENNGYTQSVPLRLEASVPELWRRGSSYGIPSLEVDGMDAEAVAAVAHSAVERARSGNGPTLIEARCYRYLPNTSNDDDSRYRSREEVEEWRGRDPLHNLRQKLTQALANAIEQETATIAAEAVEWALEQPDADPESVHEHTYA
jgi:2-oxoisovalerate dehydrogenase E1 component alpha subunit